MGASNILVPAKWVLAGEHTVLRGGEAIALPCRDYGLSLEFDSFGESNQKLDTQSRLSSVELNHWVAFCLFTALQMMGVIPDDLGALSDSSQLSLAHAPFQLANTNLTWVDQLRERFIGMGASVRSTIPQGAGLGSSAALSVAISKWVIDELRVAAAAGKLERAKLPELFSLACRLEQKFHGESSGMDIAAVMSDGPIRFSRKKGASLLSVKRMPRFSLHDSGLRGKTSVQIQRVREFRDHSPGLGERLDSEMSEAVAEALDGLLDFDEGNEAEAYALLTRSMERSFDCFTQWGLVPPEVRDLRQRLLNQGAIASRLTGAGGGGFVVALWSG